MASFGIFNESGREYIIHNPLSPIRHLVNFSWNDKIISGVNQFGTGEGVFNNQTFLYNDHSGRARMIRDGKRYFYIRDGENGAYWNIGYYPVKHEPSDLKTIFGTGYSKFIHETKGIKTESMCFAAPDEPIEIWKINVTNQLNIKKSIRVYPYVEWLLQGYPIQSDYYSYLKSEFYDDLNVIVSYNLSDERPHQRYNGFVACNLKASGYAGSVREFMGTYGDAARPSAVVEGCMPNRPSSNENLAGSLEIPVKLEAGQTAELIVLIGNTSDINETERIINKAFSGDYIDNAFEIVKSKKEEMINHTTIKTPDIKINNLINVWAKNQVALCSEFGRDGVRGFRDTLQDAWAIVSFNPELSKEKIIESLEYQKSDGSTLRGWMPVVTKHYSDGPTWITPAVTEYIKHTGDSSILDIEVPYYDEGKDTVLGHMLTALRHLNSDKGKHGLCLAHRGDWNDSLDWMGKDGRGESVMTSMAFYKSLKLFEELACKELDSEDLVKEMGDMASEIKNAIETYAWDGNWYIQGYSDFGNKVGSRENEQGRIYLVPQAWAIYSGVAQEDRADKCIAEVEKYLDSKTGCVMCYPPFTRADKNVGRLTVILPGMYENASTYCHGSAFMIASYLMKGRANEALRLYRKVMPDSDGHPSDISGVEPYAFTNQYLGPSNLRAGVSVSGWITGTAGWMYKNIINLMLGFQPNYKGVEINPQIPDEWDNISLTTRVRDAVYNMKITRSQDGNKTITVNGETLRGNFIPYNGHKNFNIEVRI